MYATDLCATALQTELSRHAPVAWAITASAALAEATRYGWHLGPGDHGYWSGREREARERCLATVRQGLGRARAERLFARCRRYLVGRGAEALPVREGERTGWRLSRLGAGELYRSIGSADEAAMRLTAANAAWSYRTPDAVRRPETLWYPPRPDDHPAARRAAYDASRLAW